MSSIFVTGTDTGVGKTLISKALIEHYISRDLRVAAMKPIASGATKTQAGLRNEDAEILLQSINTPFTYSQINPYVFEPPIAPHIAAKKNDTVIGVDTLNSAYQHLAAGSDKLIIEGAGGWQVPLNQQVTISDWVNELNCEIVMVVGIRLGCINHALLTVSNILLGNNPLLGWVANIVDSEVSHGDEIIASLSERISAPLLGEIPFLETPESSDISEFLSLGNLK